MKFLRCFFFSLLLLISCTREKPEACQSIIHYIQDNLTQTGILQLDSQGFVYLDLDDAFIHQLHAFISDQGFDEPPYFGPGLHGAHITVMDADETKKYGIGSLEENGSTIPFQVKSCLVFPLHSSQAHPAFDWLEGDLAYVILVDAPALIALRKKYGLPEKKYPFHITIGIKYLQSQAA